MDLAESIRKIDYNSLDISDYSRRYIQTLLPILDYYLDICNRALDLLPPSVHTLVDYGGGHGFLCFLAKKRGFERVIYVDYNPQASATVTALAEQIGFGPDTVLTGDHNTLKTWCDEQHITPDAVVGIDVIEHIYRLEPFFSDLRSINPRMQMVFSTASTPYNPWIRHRLHRIMRHDEEKFQQIRRDFIATLHPELSPDELNHWVKVTRGMIFNDIKSITSIESTSSIAAPPFPNTCDPITGSWTERILPIKTYHHLAAPLCVELHKGFYNSYQRGIKGIATRMLNFLLRLPFTLPLAPFIILKINAK